MTSIVDVFVYSSVVYLVVTLLMYYYVGEFFQTHVIGSYQRHLEGNVLHLHVISSVVMFITYVMQVYIKTRGLVHKIVGYVFILNMIWFVFPTSIYLTVGVIVRNNNMFDQIVLKMLFLESAFGSLLSVLYALYSIRTLHNVKLHSHFVKMCISYASTPILDRFLILFFKSILFMEYDNAHRAALMLLTLNMDYHGFIDGFIFIRTKDIFKRSYKLFTYRWILYLFISCNFYKIK